MTSTSDQRGCGHQGNLFVISGPSGVGKGTLVRAILSALPDVGLSVSATTREPRPGETEGITYHYLSNPEFDEMIEDGKLLEWASVHGQRYGTPLKEVQKALAAGKDIILEIDPQGDEQVRSKIPGVYSIFIAPPSLEELRRRLEMRATESRESVEERLQVARLEMRAKDRYNVVVVNDDLERATQEIVAIIKERSMRATRRDRNTETKRTAE